METLQELSLRLQQGRAKEMSEWIQKALDESIEPRRILEEGLLAGMGEIGEKFRLNQVFVPEVLMAARAMNVGTAYLKPHLIAQGVQPIGRACIGTVKGDMHDIGKNLVRMMLEGKGIEVIDLGVDVSPEKFVETVKEQKCDLVLLSALLTTTMGVMKDVITAFDAAGLRDQVKILVGGAPITQEFADEIGADAYTKDAATCADIAAKLLGA